MKSKVRLKKSKKGRHTGGIYHPCIFKIFKSLYESSFPEDLSGANSECEWLFDEKGKEFFCYCSSGTPISMRFKYMINVVLKTISSNSCTHLERCIYCIGKIYNTLNIIFLKKGLSRGFMARGGFREGAGRKKEYNEPVKKILLGLPESVLKQLDNYASAKNLSRPKAVAILIEQAMVEQTGNMVI